MNMKQKIYKYEAIRSFITAEVWKSSLWNTYTQNSKIKPTSKEEICFILKMHYSLEQKRVDK